MGLCFIVMWTGEYMPRNIGMKIRLGELQSSGHCKASQHGNGHVWASMGSLWQDTAERVLRYECACACIYIYICIDICVYIFI